MSSMQNMTSRGSGLNGLESNSQQSNRTRFRDISLASLPVLDQSENVMIIIPPGLQVHQIASRRGKIQQTFAQLVEKQGGVIQVLFIEFHKKFDEKYSHHLKVLNDSRFDDRVHSTYCEIRSLVKDYFMVLMKKFIKTIYKELIERAKMRLKQEGLEPRYILESVLYEILFKNPASTFNKLLQGLLMKKHGDKIRRLEEEYATRREERLADSEVLSTSQPEFILEGQEDPYAEIYEEIARLQYVLNPFSKFEIITSLCSKILNCAREHYGNDPEVRRNLCLSNDVKYGVLMYCIIKSQNTNLVVDGVIMKDFVEIISQNSSQAFDLFRGQLMELLGEDYLSSISERRLR